MNNEPMFSIEDYLGPRSERDDFLRRASVENQRREASRDLKHRLSRWLHVAYLLLTVLAAVATYECVHVHTFLTGMLFLIAAPSTFLLAALFVAACPGRKYPR
jgi:hypothetical protein